MNSYSSNPGSPVGGESERFMSSPGSPRALDDDDESTAPPCPRPRPPSHNLGNAAATTTSSAGEAGSSSVASVASPVSSWSVPEEAIAEQTRPAFIPQLEDQSAAQVVDRLRWWRVARLREQPLPTDHYVMGGNYGNYSSFGTRPLSRRLVRALRSATNTLEEDRARTTFAIATGDAAFGQRGGAGKGGGSALTLSGVSSATTLTALLSAPPTRALSLASLPAAAAAAAAAAAVVVGGTRRSHTRTPSPRGRGTSDFRGAHPLPPPDAAGFFRPTPPQEQLQQQLQPQGRVEATAEKVHPHSITPEERDLASHKKGLKEGHAQAHAHTRKPPALPTHEQREAARKERVRKAALLLSVFKPRAASAPQRSRVVRHIPASLAAAAAGKANGPLHSDGCTSPASAAEPAVVSGPLSQRVMAVASSPQLRHASALAFPSVAGSGVPQPAPVATATAVTTTAASPTSYMLPRVRAGGGGVPADPPGFALPFENTAAAPRAVVLHNPPRLVLYSRHMAPERAVERARVAPQDVETSGFMTDRPEVFALSNLPLLPSEKHFYMRQLHDLSLARVAAAGAASQRGQGGPPLSQRLQQEEGEPCESSASSLPASPLHPALSAAGRGGGGGGDGATPRVRSPLAADEERREKAWPQTDAHRCLRRLRASSVPALPSTTAMPHLLHRRHAAPPLLSAAAAADLPSVMVDTTAPAAATKHYPVSTTTPANVMKRVDDLQEVYCFNPMTDCIGVGAFSQVYAALPILRGCEDDKLFADADASLTAAPTGEEERQQALVSGTEQRRVEAGVATTPSKATRKVNVVAIKVIARRTNRKARDPLKAITAPATQHDADGMRGAANAVAGGAAGGGPVADASQRRELVEIEREIGILRRLRHTGCSCFYEAVRTPEAFVISMKMHRGSMDARQFLARFGPPSEARAALMLFQLMETIHYLHNEFGLLHRDIKLENMLVSLIDVPADRIQQVLGPDINKADRTTGAREARGRTADGGHEEDKRLGEPPTAAPPRHDEKRKREMLAAAQCRSLGAAPVDNAQQMLRVTLIDFGLARRTRNTVTGANGSSHAGSPGSAAAAAGKLGSSVAKEERSSASVAPPSQRGMAFARSPSTPRMGGGGHGRSGLPGRAMPKIASRAGMPSPMPSTANMLLKYYDVEDVDVEDEDEDEDDLDAVDGEAEEGRVESDNSVWSSDSSGSETSSLTSDEDNDLPRAELQAASPTPRASELREASPLLPHSSSWESPVPSQTPRPVQPLLANKPTFTSRHFNDSFTPRTTQPTTPHSFSAAPFAPRGVGAAANPPALSPHQIADPPPTQPPATTGVSRSLGSSLVAPSSHVLSAPSAPLGNSSSSDAAAGVAMTNTATNHSRTHSRISITASSSSPAAAQRSPGVGGAAQAPPPPPVQARREEDDANVTLLLTPCGTERYLPPEMLEWIVTHGWTRRPTTAALAKQMDMYAVGTVAYVLLSGCFPFNATTRATQLQQQRRLPRCNSERWEGVSAAAIHFVRGLLNPNPERRMTAREALQHPFLAEAAAIARKLDLVPRPHGEVVRAPLPGSALMGRPPLSQSQLLPSFAPPRSSFSSQPAGYTKGPAAVREVGSQRARGPQGFDVSLDAYQEAFLEVMGGRHGSTGSGGAVDRSPSITEIQQQQHQQHQQRQQHPTPPPALVDRDAVIRRSSISFLIESQRANEGNAEVDAGTPASSPSALAQVAEGTEEEEALRDTDGSAISEEGPVARRGGSTDAPLRKSPTIRRGQPSALTLPSFAPPFTAGGGADAAGPSGPSAMTNSEPAEDADLFDQLYNDIMCD